jgi:hypothetical protein
MKEPIQPIRFYNAVRAQKKGPEAYPRDDCLRECVWLVPRRDQQCAFGRLHQHPACASSLPPTLFDAIRVKDAGSPSSTVSFIPAAGRRNRQARTQPDNSGWHWPQRLDGTDFCCPRWKRSTMANRNNPLPTPSNALFVQGLAYS